MNKFNRRNFLLSTMGTAAASQFPWAVKAQSTQGIDDKLFVQIQIEGGFDVLSSLDPYIDGDSPAQLALYKDYLNSDIRGDQVIFAPGAHALLDHVSDLVVLNGVSMRGQETSHEGCRAYFASGAQGQGKNSHLVAEIAAIHGAGPFGVIANNQGSFTNKRSEISISLTNDLNPSEVSANDPRFNLPTINGEPDPFWDSLNAFINSVNIVKNYNSLLTEASATFNTENSKVDFEVRVAAALGSGLSRHAFLNLGGDFVTEPGYGGLDSHSGFQGEHIKKQTKYFERLAKILRLFKNVQYKETGKSLFDVTTFFVTNEFSRSAQLSGGGKDHNPETTSGLLIGRGVFGNQVIGRSHLFSGTYPMMSALPIDYATGRSMFVHDLKDIAEITATDSTVRMMKPENVVASILDIMDIPQDKFTNFKIPGIKKIPGLKK